MTRKERFNQWLFYSDGNVLDPDSRELAEAVKDALSHAKCEAYLDAAKCVANGMSYTAIYNVLCKKAEEHRRG